MMWTVVRAVVLAAGASSRMGRPKAALSLAHRADTFLARIIRSLSAAGVADIVVVTGALADIVRLAAGPTDRRVRFVHNPRWEDGQLSSLLAGLGDPTPELEAILLTLVDVPLVSTATIAAVLSAWRVSRAPIVRPARGDAHGHPVIFDRAVFEELRRADLAAGAKTVVRTHAAEILNVPTDDLGAFADVDTPEAYEATVAALRNPQQ
jgi:molybdenum cofactor cytidylyltransferase